jgi:hypothetical protein
MNTQITLLEAIAKMEGFFIDGSRPQRNNNPGDIEYGKFTLAHAHCTLETVPDGEVARFAHFETTTDGYAVLAALLRSDGYKGLTLRKCIYRYAPPNENSSLNYVDLICEWTGLSPDDIIDAFIVPEVNTIGIADAEQS